jgi:hypothetical protein
VELGIQHAKQILTAINFREFYVSFYVNLVQILPQSFITQSPLKVLQILIPFLHACGMSGQNILPDLYPCYSIHSRSELTSSRPEVKSCLLLPS